MATTLRSGGLQSAVSLGNIEASTRANINQSTRSYESEGENMSWRKTIPHASEKFTKTSVYSKGDMREQYCLRDTHPSSIERPIHERFFGCWSGKSVPQTFLGVCVGLRAPSEENLDNPRINTYPRYPSMNRDDEFLPYDEDIESSYFRRRPTSFLGGDPKRYTWMPADEEAVRLERPRPICPDMDDINCGPYVVGSYPTTSFFSHSTEQLAGLHRCPAHIDLPPPPPPPVLPSIDGTGSLSFSRSNTVTSFEPIGVRPLTRLSTSRTQERLIGGKKTIKTLPHLQEEQHQHQMQQQDKQHQQSQEVILIEKIKRNAMKTQATQTEKRLSQKAQEQHQQQQQQLPHRLLLSPRTIHRVSMVSQEAQTNGGLTEKKLMKSLSEAGGSRMSGVGADSTSPLNDNETFDHEMLHRTQSEESSGLSFDVICSTSFHQHQPDSYSRTSSRSDQFSSENIFTHSRTSSFQSQDSTGSFRSTEMSDSRSHDSADSFNYSQEHIINSRKGPHISRDTYARKEMEPIYRTEVDCHSLPRRSCIHHKKEEIHAEILDANDLLLQELFKKERRESESRDDSVDLFYEKPSSTKSLSTHGKHHVPIRRASHAVVTPETHISYRRCSMQNQLNHLDDVSSECGDDSKEEREILIDFKPRMSPKPNTKTRRNRLQKFEILLERNREKTLAPREKLKTSDKIVKSGSTNRNTSIKNVANCQKHVSEIHSKSNRFSREKFRKRSISFEEPFKNIDDCTSVKSAPPSPYLDELSAQTHLLFASTDSLVNNFTLDHSDGIWNESQATVLQAKNTTNVSPSETVVTLPTSSATGKQLLSEHLTAVDSFEAKELIDKIQTSSTRKSTSAMRQTMSESSISTQKIATIPYSNIKEPEVVDRMPPRKLKTPIQTKRKDLRKPTPRIQSKQLKEIIEPTVHSQRSSSESSKISTSISDQQIKRTVDTNKDISLKKPSTMNTLSRCNAIYDDLSHVEEIPLPPIPKPYKKSGTSGTSVNINSSPPIYKSAATAA